MRDLRELTGVRQLNGIFAFALWTARGGGCSWRVTARRETPLLESQVGDGIVFASSSSALLAFPELSRTL